MQLEAPAEASGFRCFDPSHRIFTHTPYTDDFRKLGTSKGEFQTVSDTEVNHFAICGVSLLRADTQKLRR